MKKRFLLGAYVALLIFSGCGTRSEKLAYQIGVASFYGPGFDGNPTANGETFDQNALTAAHRHLPFNSIVDVSDLATGKTVRVRINDRGPFIEGRIIDLSQRAATDLGIVGQGIASVVIVVASTP